MTRAARRRAGRIPPEALDRVLILLIGELDRPAQPVQRGAERVLGLRQQRYRISDHVLGDRLAMAIQNAPARRGGRYLPQPVLFRLQQRVLVADDLRAEERAQKKREHAAHDHTRGAPAPHDVVRMKAHAVRTSISGFSNDNTTTPATAVTAAESGDQTKICIASSAPCA